jgi:hypothetical protein
VKGAVRRVICLVLGAVLLTLGFPAEAQQPGRIHRVGFLSGAFPPSTGIDAVRGSDALQRELRELGYIEGKNIAFEYRYAEDKPKPERPPP